MYALCTFLNKETFSLPGPLVVVFSPKNVFKKYTLNFSSIGDSLCRIFAYNELVVKRNVLLKGAERN